MKLGSGNVMRSAFDRARVLFLVKDGLFLFFFPIGVDCNYGKHF